MSLHPYVIFNVSRGQGLTQETSCLKENKTELNHVVSCLWCLCGWSLFWWGFEGLVADLRDEHGAGLVSLGVKVARNETILFQQCKGRVLEG